MIQTLQWIYFLALPVIIGSWLERKVIAESNGHHWINAFNLTCCRDCGIVRRRDDKNKLCRGVVKVGLREQPEQAAGCGDPNGKDPNCDYGKEKPDPDWVAWLKPATDLYGPKDGT